MNIEALLHHPWITAGLGSVGTFLGTYVAPIVVDQLSGKADISRNVGNIQRSAQDYASQMGLDADKIKTSPLDLKTVGSLFIVNAESASLTLVSGDTPKRHSVRLDSDAGLFALLNAHRYMDDPKAVFDILGRQASGDITQTPELKDARKERESWVRPAPSKRLFTFLDREAAFNERAAKIREPLDFLAKVMAASPEADITLSGPCHIALKLTDISGRADIIVMPTMACEAEIIKGIETGTHALADRSVSPQALRAALVEMHSRNVNMTMRY